MYADVCIQRVSYRKFDLKAAASFAIGNSTEKSRVITTDTEPGDPPYRLTDYYNLQNEYATAPQATLRLGLRYHFNHGIYAEVQEVIHAVSTFTI